MKKNIKASATFLFSFVAITLFMTLSTTLLSFASSNNLTSNSTIHISLVNASGKTVCIQDNQSNQCSDSPNQEFLVKPQNFYERNGVIRVSIGDQPLKIAMVKKDIQEINIYIDNSGKMHAPEGVFEKGSFIYSDNSDYLYFAVKPNALFSSYPV